MTFIVNGRSVQPRGLQSLVETAYRTVLPRGRHPLATLVVEIAPDRVDINIHPAKLEVRLRDERAIGAALGEMIRGALGRRPLPLREPLEFGRTLLDPPNSIREEREGWDEERPILTPNLPPLTLIGQVQGRLLLLEGASGLYLVDQHRAHERIIFERLTASHPDVGAEHQVLPEPLLIELRPAQSVRFARRLGDLSALGFHCEEFGGRTFLLRATPILPGVFQSLSGTPLGSSQPLGEADQLVSTLLCSSVTTMAIPGTGVSGCWCNFPAEPRSVVAARLRDRRCARSSTRSAIPTHRRFARTALRYSCTSAARSSNANSIGGESGVFAHENHRLRRRVLKIRRVGIIMRSDDGDQSAIVCTRADMAGVVRRRSSTSEQCDVK